MLTQSQKEAKFDSYLTEILSIQSTLNEPGRAAVPRSDSVDPAGMSPISGHTSGVKTAQSQSLMTRMTSPLKGKNSSRPTCHGLLAQGPPPQNVIATPVARKPVGFCEHTTSTSQKPNSILRSPPPHQQASPLRNGSTSLKEMPLTSTTSLRHSTMLSLMKREQVAWEK